MFNIPKDWITLTAIGSALGYIGVNSIAYEYTKSIAEANPPISSIKPPPSTVSIIMPVLNEKKEDIFRALNSLKNNNIVKKYPQAFEFIYVGGPEPINDPDIIKAFDMVLSAPLGKLNARDKAIKASRGDIIVAVDADRYYPKNWLNLLIEPLHNSDVVGTTGYVVYGNSFEPWSNVVKQVYYTTKMDGGGSVFWKDAYYAIGGYNLKIDQFNWVAMINEEEVNFKKKLEMLGKKVIYVPVPSYSLIRLSTPWRLGIKPFI